MKIREMKPEDPCICGSGKGWKACCGVLLDNKDCGMVQVTREAGEKVRFYLGTAFDTSGYEVDGQRLVFTNRAQALSLNEKLGYAWQVVGMIQPTWERFQKEIPNHVVITDALA